MAEDTKACSLTEYEVTRLIEMYGNELGNKYNEEKIERINYLNKRLKAFKEEAPKEQPPTPPTEQKAASW